MESDTYMRKALQNKIENHKGNQIDLGGLNITDNELEEIIRKIVTDYKNVDKIFLNNNLIGERGAKALAKNFTSLNNLLFLDIQSNRITKEGISALIQLQVKLPNLKIAFHGNEIIDQGEMADLAHSIKKNHS